MIVKKDLKEMVRIMAPLPLRVVIRNKRHEVMISGLTKSERKEMLSCLEELTSQYRISVHQDGNDIFVMDGIVTGRNRKSPEEFTCKFTLEFISKVIGTEAIILIGDDFHSRHDLTVFIWKTENAIFGKKEETLVLPEDKTENLDEIFTPLMTSILETFSVPVECMVGKNLFYLEIPKELDYYPTVHVLLKKIVQHLE